MILLAQKLIHSDEPAAFAFIILQHLIDLLLVIAGDAIREDRNGVVCLSHIKTSRLDAGRCIGTGNDKLVYIMSADEIRERLAGQRIPLGFDKDIIRYDLHFRHQLGANHIGLESPCAGG